MHFKKYYCFIFMNFTDKLAIEINRISYFPSFNFHKLLMIHTPNTVKHNAITIVVNYLFQKD